MTDAHEQPEWELVLLCPHCESFMADAAAMGLNLGGRIKTLYEAPCCQYEGPVAVVKARFHPGGWFSSGWWEHYNPEVHGKCAGQTEGGPLWPERWAE